LLEQRASSSSTLATRWIESDAISASERLRLAALLAAGEQGYGQFTVRQVIESAGTAKGTFYKHFSDKADCFAQAYTSAIETFAAQIFAAAGAAPDWRGGVRAGLAELLNLVASDPIVARAVLIAPEAAGARVQARYAEQANRFATALDTARGETLPYRPPQAGTFVLGGIREVVVSRLRSDEEEWWAGLLPGLVQFALLPYFGEQVAWEELKAAATMREEGDGE
jgi:AcrR family transcriptional regulator